MEASRVMGVESLSLKGVKAWLCDMDGTLTDSIPLLYSVYGELMKSHGLEPSMSQFWQLAGPPLPEALAWLSRQYGWQEDVEELVKGYLKQLSCRYIDEVALHDGAYSCLVKAAEQGLRLVLVTSSPRRLAECVLEKQGLKSYFEAIVAAEDVKRGKPDPEPYIKAIELLHLQPSQVRVIEDSPLGVESALRAGLKTLYFKGEEAAVFESGAISLSGWPALEKLLIEHSFEGEDQ